MTIGVAGVGKMGAAIAARLMDESHSLVVWNRSAAKTRPLQDAGAKAASSPAQLAQQSDVIITILTDAAAIDAVYSGTDGLLGGAVKGKLFIDMSTLPPAAEVALADEVRAAGAAFVECPVGGTVGPARQGKLIGMMGGEPADAERAKPIMQQLCRRLEYCGPVGTGSAIKLAINLPLMIYWQALGEALAISRHVGMEPARLIDLLGDTSGGTNVLKVRGAAIAKMLDGDDGGATAFDLDSARKDLRTMIAEGKSHGVDLPLAERTLACFDEASGKGLGRRDASALAIYWSDKASA